MKQLNLLFIWCLLLIKIGSIAAQPLELSSSTKALALFRRKETNQILLTKYTQKNDEVRFRLMVAH